MASRAIALDEMTGAPLLRNSERQDWRNCPWKWEQTWLNGIRSKREPTWAWFGTAIHRALETRYPIGQKRGAPGDVHDAFDEALDQQERRIYTEGSEVDPDAIVDGRKLGHAMLTGYLETYGADSHWQVLHTEAPFQINVPHPTKKGAVLAVLAGTWDLAIWDRNEKVYKIVDHKTRRSFPTNWAFYNLNTQAGTYLWVAREVLIHKGILKKKDVISGLVFNTLKKSMPDKRPKNAQGLATNKPTKAHYVEALQQYTTIVQSRFTVEMLQELAYERGITVLGEVSNNQPVPLFHREEVWRSPQERISQARQVQSEALIMDGMRKGILPIYKNPTEDCTRCQLFELCELDEQNPEEAAEFARMTMTIRDPYADHRENMTRGGVAL